MYKLSIIWLVATILTIGIANAGWSQPKTILGFKHISQTHKPNCHCIVVFNGKLVMYVVEADAVSGFVKIQSPEMKKAVTVYGDVQIFPVKIRDGYIRVLTKSEIRVLQRKFFLQGF